MLGHGIFVVELDGMRPWRTAPSRRLVEDAIAAEGSALMFQNVVVIRHKVASYRKWKVVFEAHGQARLAHGCQRAHVFRRADNPKELVVMLAWSDLGKARQFLASDDLREMLAEAGVLDRPPDVYLLEELEQTCPSASPPTLHEPTPQPSGDGTPADRAPIP